MNPIYQSMKTSVFERMSLAATRNNAVNLGQGFPDFGWPDEILEFAARALKENSNQYAPSRGLPALREAVAAHYQRHFSQDLAAEHVCVTSGATEALGAAILATVEPGDEVIIFTPAYDSYAPMIRRAGATPVEVTLQPPAWRLDPEALGAAASSKTSAILFNNPHNPAGRLFDRDELDVLAGVARQHDLIVISDEVYEHVVVPGVAHASVLGHPVLAQRSFAIFSFGKSLHATGLRIGYAVAPPALSIELRKVHQFNTFTIATALQHAIAGYLAEKPEVFDGLAPFFDVRRRCLLAALQGTGLVPIPAQGTYFQLVDYSGCAPLAGLSDVEASMALVTRGGVATIPLSPFYREPPKMPVIRLCFAKQEATLVEAGVRLRAFAEARP